MKYVDEYRDAGLVKKLTTEIARCISQPWTIMEICGGQTHSIVKYGLEEILPDSIRLVHGPGCPVCVTPLEIIDKAITIASQPGVILASFGDMLRVPGSSSDLLKVKASGGDVRIVYSPLDALKLAQNHPGNEVVFFSVGFETTAPANALSVSQAKKMGLKNYSLLSAHVLVPPAMQAILSSPDNTIQGFLAAGHVCTIMGFKEYEPLAEEFKIPITITGFEPVDILQGILMTVRQLEKGTFRVENQYSRVVTRDGNTSAQQLIRDVFRVIDRKWRGIGTIPMSGLDLTPAYNEYNADVKFTTTSLVRDESPDCIAGEVLMGMKKPSSCFAFGKKCTPEHPLGAPMVSSEGACAAYFRYKKSEPHE